jgi:hypothetical protein
MLFISKLKSILLHYEIEMNCICIIWYCFKEWTVVYASKVMHTHNKQRSVTGYELLEVFNHGHISYSSGELKTLLELASFMRRRNVYLNEFRMQTMCYTVCTSSFLNSPVYKTGYENL